MAKRKSRRYAVVKRAKVWRSRHSHCWYRLGYDSPAELAKAMVRLWHSDYLREETSDD